MAVGSIVARGGLARPLPNLVQLVLLGVQASGFRIDSTRTKRFRGGLVFDAHRLLYDSTLGLRVIKKREEEDLHPHEVALHALLRDRDQFQRLRHGPDLVLPCFAFQVQGLGSRAR